MSSSTTSPSNVQSIFDAALSDYTKRNHVDLATHSFAQALQTCDSAEAILVLFQDKANQFQEYRDGNRKLIDCLKPVVRFLHTVAGILAEAATLVPFQPTKAVLVGVDVLLTASIGVSASYDALVDLFKRVGSFLNRLRIYNGITLSPSMSEILINIMVEVLSVLSLATKEIKKGRLRKFVRKMFGERKIEDALQRLDHLTLDEARMTGTETLQVVHHLKSVIISDVTTSEYGTRKPPIPMQESMVKMERLHFLREIRSWLSPPDPSKNHNIARASHHDGTTDWLLHSHFFEQWTERGSLLWIHGNAGSGKSIICSSIIQHVKTNCDRGRALMGYYYFSFNEIAKQGTRGLLTSLLSQFCAKSDPCYEIISNLYSENDAGSQQPDNIALTESLKEILRLPQVPMRYIILDGVDECPNTSGFPTPREEVLEFLKEIVGLNLSNLRICVTSRPEVDIRTALEPLAPLLVPLQDQIGQKQAILDYIRNVVHSDPRMERWTLEDKQLVIDTLSSKAEGMFRWAYCQLETLRRCPSSDISRALDALPETLDETYERTLLGIEKEKREYAHRLFQCLTVAIRPLHLDELAEVLAIRFDSGQLPKYNPDWRLEDAQYLVLSACSSLISVVDVDGSPVIKFSHFSVKEFLTSDRLANSANDLSRFHIEPHSAHTILAQASLTLLLHLGDRVDKDSIKQFPFTRYAAQHWVDHGHFGDVSLSIQNLMERLFDIDEPSFATWIWIYDIDYPFRQHMFEDRPPRPEAVPLYYATLCGFRSLVEQLIVNHRDDIDAKGGKHGSAVNAALVKRHVEIALLLLEHGADVNIFDNGHDTPLCIASRSGRHDIVELLIEHHADVNLANRDTGDTPLCLAAQEGEVEIAGLLLRCGAIFDFPSKDGTTPLTMASRCGHLDIVTLLIHSGAAVDSPDNDSWTPLMSASGYGYLPVVKELLDHGAAINAQRNGCSTPLHLASFNGHLSVVEHLVERHADIDGKNEDQQTSLHWAATNGHLDVAHFLLKSGSSPNSQDSDGRTPLHMAARHGHLKLVKLLLESSADVNLKDHGNSIPLDMACASRKREVTKYLANHMGVADPLDGIDVIPFKNPDDMNSDTTSTSARIAKPTNILSDHRDISLHDASAAGNIQVVRLLLDQGADVNQRNTSHRTPLDVASTKGELEVAKLLVEYGADVNCRDKEGWTPLLDASTYGHCDIAVLVLDHGADINAKNEDLRTPLHLASWNFRREIVRLLLERGADIHARDIDGRTPYALASKAGDRDIMRLLLDATMVED